MEGLTENINGWYSLIALIFGGIGSLITWFSMRRLVKKKLISEYRRDEKVNNVEGDSKLIEQLDTLLTKVAEMSEAMLEIQVELNVMKNKELSYKSAFHRLNLLCDEICEKSEFCKEKIRTILEDLNLLDDATNGNN